MAKLSRKGMEFVKYLTREDCRERESKGIGGRMSEREREGGGGERKRESEEIGGEGIER